jgi:tetratricopeptide (TPR) repeat protein
LAIRLYSKIRNYENKIPVGTNEKTRSINDIQKDTKTHGNVSIYSAQWYLDKAKDFEDIAQYDRALKDYDKAIEKEPYNFVPIYNKALLLERIEKFNEALEAIEQAIDLEPNNADIWYHKAYILEKLEKYEDAIKALNIDLRIDPKDVKSWTSKTNLLQKLGRYNDAIECIDNILRNDPKNEDALNKRNIIQEEIDKRSNEPKETIQDTNAEDVQVLDRKCNALYHQGKYQEAIECYDKV